MKPLPSRELGLALGLIVGRHVLGMEDLHYGYWPDGLAPTLRNLPQAQAHYTEFLLSQLPASVKTVLDVGAGAGNTAARLLDRGLAVDCLSPNPTLNQVIRERLGERVGLFETRFEDHRSDERYDLVLFSECLLFIHLRPGLERALELVPEGGHVLISDLFRTTTERGPIGGGHDLATFRSTLASLPWRVVADHDVTARIAPTFDALDETYRALRPGYDLLLAQLAAKYPWTYRLARWLFRRRIERYEKKHFSGQRNAAAFMRHKQYRVLLLQKGAR